jgi:ABC-2 type transport system ATP-binding protein
LYAQEFVAFHGGVYGLDRDRSEARAAELLDALGLGGQSRKPLAEFSAGMRKRVAFAAAIVHRPDILFLDEPFESVDPAGVALMKQWLRDIASQGRTVFLASHVLETVERLCDRVAIVKAPGQVDWQGDITGFTSARRVEVEGRAYATLEDLYLDLSGRQTAAMGWL